MKKPITLPEIADLTLVVAFGVGAAYEHKVGNTNLSISCIAMAVVLILLIVVNRKTGDDDDNGEES